MPVAQYIDTKTPKNSYIGCANRPIVPLTNNKKALLKEIKAWKPQNHTSSDTALSWGWGLLSPKWNDLWKKKSEARPYNKDVKKYLVLMTDGANTMKHFSADKESLGLCAAIKDKGIKIYSIAFKAGSNAQKLLKACATQPDMYINASSGAALKAAFERIAEEVGTFYLSG